VGKSINQIDVDAIEAELAGGEEQIARHFVRLDAVDGLLDFGLEVLNAHTEAIEAEFAESLEMLAGGHARVNFDANLTVGVEVEMFSGECEQILDLFRSQIGWRAAAPMKLDHGTISRDAAADALHLLLQNVEVGRRDALVLLNDDVASAKEAETFTEGNVHVKRNGRPGTLGFCVDALEIGGTESIVLDRRILQNAMTEIEDVAAAAKRTNSAQRRIANFLWRSEQDGGIDISLQCNFGTQQFANFGQIHAPVHAERICARTSCGGKQMLRRLRVINHRGRTVESRA